jgi:hypothetical protein
MTCVVEGADAAIEHTSYVISTTADCMCGDPDALALSAQAWCSSDAAIPVQ